MAVNYHRRACVLALATGALGVGRLVNAQQTYPTKQIRIIVPFAAGGATDAIARIIGEKLGTRLGQAAIVENRTGAAGITGTDAVAKAPPDGHTLMVGITTNMLINQYLYNSLPYNPQRDLTLISQIGTAAIILLVHSSVPANNAQELVEYVKKNKGKLSYGSYGIGSQAHLAGAHMSRTLNADMSHVPYRGEAPMLQDLIGGRIHMAYGSALSVKPFLETGKLKAIGITGEQRLPVLPNVPTLSEQGLKDDIYRMVGWYGAAAPAGTPKAIVQRLSDEIRVVLDMPEVKSRLIALGAVPTGTSPEAFVAIYNRDAPVWEQAVKASGAKAD